MSDDSAIRIRIRVGPQAGLQVIHQESLITFGRSPDNKLVIPIPEISRHHGQLARSETGWVFLSSSPNPTTLNGRKVEPGKPLVMNPGDVVAVGGVKLFDIQFTPTAPASATPADAPAQPDPSQRSISRRGRLWIGIGIYLLIMLVIFLVAASAARSKPGPALAAEPLTDQQITDEIHRPITQSLDERESARHLSEAQGLYPRTESSNDGLYQVHHHYKLAMAYSGKAVLDGIDQLRFNEVEHKLIESIIRDYRNAYARLRSREWDGAEKAFFALAQAYPDSRSLIHQNIQKQLTAINQNRPKKKFR